MRLSVLSGKVLKEHEPCSRVKFNLDLPACLLGCTFQCRFHHLGYYDGIVPERRCTFRVNPLTSDLKKCTFEVNLELMGTPVYWLWVKIPQKVVIWV